MHRSGPREIAGRSDSPGFVWCTRYDRCVEGPATAGKARGASHNSEPYGRSGLCSGHEEVVQSDCVRTLPHVPVEDDPALTPLAMRHLRLGNRRLQIADVIQPEGQLAAHRRKAQTIFRAWHEIEPRSGTLLICCPDNGVALALRGIV